MWRGIWEVKMNSMRKVLLRTVPALALSAAACTAARLAVTPTLQTGDPAPLMPQPLKIIAEERLGAPSNPRYPPADFGHAIALGDGILAVGAPSITGGPEYSAPGSVYLYERGSGGWVEGAQLTASDQNDGFQYAQQFGAALAMQDKFLFVGAPNADDPKAGDNTGAVYIFESGSDGWEEIGILKSPDPVANAQFGTLLAVSGEHLGILEGYPYQGGRLRLFQGQEANWRQTALIEAPALEGGHSGFATFDLYGDTLAVGTLSFQGEGAETRISGKILLYEFNGMTWITTGSLPQDVFGSQLALDGQGSKADRLALASPFSQLNGFMSGSVTLFSRKEEEWILEETLASPDVGSSTYWGSGYGGTVALRGDLLLAGGPGFSEDTFWDGVAYLYQFSGGRWVDQLRLTHAEDGGFGDFFGSQVAIFGDTLLVSAPNEFGNAVYVFEVGVR
jgi:hypothetical protein